MSFLKEMLISIPIIIVVFVLIQHMVIVPTESMVPVISGGDIVLVEKIDFLGIIKEFNPEDIKVGDIIVYEESNSSQSSNTTNGNEVAAKSSSNGSEEQIIHRVVEIKKSNGKEYFILKGDNNDVPDPSKVYPEQVVGKALAWGNSTLVIPKLGQLFEWIP